MLIEESVRLRWSRNIEKTEFGGEGDIRGVCHDDYSKEKGDK